MSVCTGIMKIDTITTGDCFNEVLEVTIDNTITALWIYKYSDALQYVNKEVIVEYRDDIYKGVLRKFINTLTVLTVVSTLDKKENIRLYSNQIDEHSNITFCDLNDGDSKVHAIMYCVEQTYESSARASWCSLTVRDKMMRIATLRLFDYDKEVDFTGKYISADIRKSKYGLQCEMVYEVSSEFTENIEVTIGRQFIMNHFSDDETALKFINSTGILEGLATQVDYERGYGIVRLAMELAMTEQFYNVTNDIKIKAIEHALLASYSYVTNTTPLSAAIRSVVVASRYSWPDVLTVLKLLDPACEDRPVEYEVYMNIKKTIASIIDIRKGIKHL